MSTTTSARRTAPPMVATLAGIALLVVAVVLVLSLTPALVRTLVVLPVVVLVAGQSATQLVLGHRTRSRPGGPAAAVVAGDPELDGLLRVTLPVLLGVLALLLAILVTAMIGFPLDTVSATLGAAGIALVLLLVARWRTLVPGMLLAKAAPVDATAAGSRSAGSRSAGTAAVPAAAVLGPRPIPLPRPSTVRTGLGVLVAVLVLAAAVTGATSLMPTAGVRYSLISLDDQAVLAGGPVESRSDTPVELKWTLRSFGYQLTGPDPTVDVTVGGAPVTGVVASAPPPTAAGAGDSGALSRQDGTVAFSAPSSPGLYDVRITVTSQGEPDQPPAVLAVTLEVKP